MIKPKVVFEPVLGRWRVEYRIRADKWVGDQCFPTLAAAELREAVTDEIHSVVAAFSDSQMETLLTGDLVAAHERVAVLTHSKEKNMSNPKVVFEATLSRWRVESRGVGRDAWRLYRYFPTLDEAREVAQRLTDDDFDCEYRVVDTQAEDDTQPDAVRVGDETPLTLDAYQEQAKATAVYPEDKAREYLVAGLAGEVGELASIFAKYWRVDGDLKFTHAAAELGDVLWFVAMLAEELGCDLSIIAANNLDKLADRAVRGKLKGNGDNR